MMRLDQSCRASPKPTRSTNALSPVQQQQAPDTDNIDMANSQRVLLLVPGAATILNVSP
jgi:hypothetical protein